MLTFKHNLVGILADVQTSPEHYITKEAQYISDKLGIFLAMYMILSFYAALSDKPKEICDSSMQQSCCKVMKYEKIKAAIEKELKVGVGEITPDGMFSFEYSSSSVLVIYHLLLESVKGLRKP